MTDTETAIRAYAAQRGRAGEPERQRRYRNKHRTPVPIQWTPPPEPPPRIDWRTRLDARITRCPGCDQWQWDNHCGHCMAERTSAA